MDNKHHNIYNKETLIEKFSKKNFPLDKISNEALQHKQILFTNSSEKPLVSSNLTEINPEFYEWQSNVNQNRYNKNFNSNNSNKYHNNYKKNSNNHINEWRKNEEVPSDKNPTTEPIQEYIEPKKQSKGQALKLNTKEIQASSQSGDTKTPVKTGENCSSTKLDKVTPSKKKIIEEDVLQQYFQDEIEKVIILNSVEKIEKTKKMFTFSKKSEEIKVKNEEFTTDFLSTISNKLQISLDEYLYYILHPQANSSYGPLTSKEIKELIEANVLTLESDIRFIDTYCLKDLKPFSFFKLKEMARKSFLDEIEPSPLIKRTEILLKNSEVHQLKEQKLTEHSQSQIQTQPQPQSSIQDQSNSHSNIQDLQNQDHYHKYEKEYYKNQNNHRNHNQNQNQHKNQNQQLKNQQHKNQNIQNHSENQNDIGKEFSFGPDSKKPESETIKNNNLNNIKKFDSNKATHENIKVEEEKQAFDKKSNTYVEQMEFKGDLHLENKNDYNKKLSKKKKGKKPIEVDIKLGNFYFL